jgi:GNAT superfamily N-acetyltransferase
MITAAIESFELAIPEIKELIQFHWQELALNKDTVPLSPQWDEYVRREKNGTLFLATVRRDGKIAAYYIAQVAPGFHYSQTLTGTMDIAYVVPDQRQKGLAIPLFRTVEREMRRRGVKIWFSGWKTNNPLGMDKLLDAFGFTPADTYAVKRLD